VNKVVTLIGTRPEIIKISAVVPLLDERFEHILVHSGQHYSYEMDALFFRELGLRSADYTLAAGSASHAEQTARMLSRLEPILLDERPDMMLVHGDTNTTLSGGLCAAKLGIPVTHMEAGCRSFNRAMPEELNRTVVDHLTDLLLPPDEIARQNLLAEGIPDSRIQIIGSTVIDAVERNRHFAAESPILQQLELEPGTYLVLTLHRAENTTPEQLPQMVRALNEAAERHPFIFPIHPRTAAALREQQLELAPRIRVCEPLGYLDMLKLLGSAKALLTDSGGLQEEAAVLGTPVLIIRNETEWRYLVDAGANVLIGNSYESISNGLSDWLEPHALDQLRAAKPPIAFGASERGVELMAQYLEAH
jgi:UDP-N-acetylglucosamine 2-epimerase (non-hydrolysing)